MQPVLVSEQLNETKFAYLKLPYSAGTKHPHMATTVISPIWRRYVLFPVLGVKRTHTIVQWRVYT